MIIWEWCFEIPGVQLHCDHLTLKAIVGIGSLILHGPTSLDVFGLPCYQWRRRLWKGRWMMGMKSLMCEEKCVFFMGRNIWETFTINPAVALEEVCLFVCLFVWLFGCSCLDPFVSCQPMKLWYLAELGGRFIWLLKGGIGLIRQRRVNHSEIIGCYFACYVYCFQDVR